MGGIATQYKELPSTSILADMLTSVYGYSRSLRALSPMLSCAAATCLPQTAGPARRPLSLLAQLPASQDLDFITATVSVRPVICSTNPCSVYGQHGKMRDIDRVLKAQARAPGPCAVELLAAYRSGCCCAGAELVSGGPALLPGWGADMDTHGGTRGCTCADELLGACESEVRCCPSSDVASGGPALLPGCGAEREALCESGNGDSVPPLSGTA